MVCVAGMCRIRVVLAAALLAAWARGALAAPGDLDPTFNGGALKLLELSNTTPGTTQFHAVRVDGAGRIIAAGLATDENELAAVVVARLTPDGNLDPDFGDGGSLVTQAGRGGGTVLSLVMSLSPRPGGAGWIATGGASASDGRQAALALAVDDAGNLDLGFGTGGTTRVQAAGAPPEFTLAFGGGGGSDLDGDGNAYIAHSVQAQGTEPSLVVVKVTPQGQLATGFAGGGVYRNQFSQTPGSGNTYGDVALVVPGGVLVAGNTLDAAGRGAVLLLRLTPAGALDGTFAGGSGYRVLQAASPLAPAPFSLGDAIALGPGGAIYVAGNGSDGNGHAAFAVARFDENGTVDPAFGTNGVARVQTATADPGATPASYARAVAVQPDGRVLLVGTSGAPGYSEIVVIRLTTSGVVDPEFGNGGIVRLQPALTDPLTYGSAGMITPDGTALVIAGNTSEGNRGVVGRILLASPTTTTTTTTLPGCGADPSLATALCRANELRASVDAVAPSGKLRGRLLAALDQAIDRATTSGTLSEGRRKKLLKRALRALGRFQKQLRARKARQALPADVTAAWTSQAASVADVLEAVRAAS
jgi:uncharacterized delta-60 repeat protein